MYKKYFTFIILITLPAGNVLGEYKELERIYNQETYTQVQQTPYSQVRSDNNISSEQYDIFIKNINSMPCDEKFNNFYEVISLFWGYYTLGFPFNCFNYGYGHKKYYKKKVNRFHSYFVSINDQDLQKIVLYIYNNYWLPNNYIQKELQKILNEISSTPDMGTQMYCEDSHNRKSIFNIERDANGRILFHPSLYNSKSKSYYCIRYLKRSAEDATRIQKYFFRQGSKFTNKFLTAARTYISLVNEQENPIVKNINSKKRLELIPLTEYMALSSDNDSSSYEISSENELVTFGITINNYQPFIDYTKWAFDSNFSNRLEIVKYNGTKYISSYLPILSKYAYTEWLNSISTKFYYRLLNDYDRKRIEVNKLDPPNISFFRLIQSKKITDKQ